MIGRELDGRYRVLDKLGEGAMGSVYLVEHLQLGRREAFKVLHAHLADSDAFIRRFQREARATNRLQHANIIAVHDLGQLPDGSLYLTTEYADGESLRRALEQAGRFPVPRALRVLGQLADAIGHAHERGVIHRDLKPENMILVSRRGQSDILKVLDFGIAKIIAPDYQSVGLTRQGEVFGTPAYMAPEQVKGEGKDPRIDIYAAGCIAYHLLVGQPPFLGGPIQVMHKHVSEMPPLPSERAIHADVPRELDQIVERCMEKDPNRRFQTGKALFDAIKRVPGYPAKTGSGRRSYRTIPASPSTTAPATGGGFDEDEQTEDRPLAAVGSLETIAGSDPDTATHTMRFGPEHTPIAIRQAVRGIAEALREVGCSDFQLLIGLANLEAAEGELDRIDAQLDELDEQTTVAEQHGREREAALRFAIGELRFERDQAVARNETVDNDVDFQIRELEKRLSAVAVELDQELMRLDDRGITLAARRASKEEELDRLFVAFSDLVEELSSHFATHGDIRRLVAQLQALRASAM